ncbi:MAG: D-alanyl-D-alanine carboxypeptidase family protein [Lachnospiraceae bacterium]
MLRKIKILSGIIIGALFGLLTSCCILYFFVYDNLQWQNANYIYYSCTSENEPKTLEEPTQLYARYAALADAGTGNILFSKNGSEKVPMASTTKIMTCIIALEAMSPEETCIASKYAASMPDVQMDLVAGEEFCLKDLLYALMLRSYNDSAVVIAENVAFDYLGRNKSVNPELYKKVKDTGLDKIDTATSKELVSIFAGLMNEKAVSLGCNDTYFITPNGLDASDDNSVHSSTAIDMCHIMAYCIKNQDFLSITQTQEYTFKSSKRTYSFTNANTFFQMMDGVISGKTGFTNDAGYCYVCALENDGRTYVSAVLASGWPGNKTYKWLDTKKLLKFGINNFFSTNLVNKIPSLSLLTPTGNKETYGMSEKYEFSPLLSGNENFLYEYEIVDNGIFSSDVYLNIYIDNKLIDSILL